MRNDSYTEKIVNAIESEMYDLLALPENETSPLLRRASIIYISFGNNYSLIGMMVNIPLII